MKILPPMRRGFTLSLFIFVSYVVVGQNEVKPLFEQAEAFYEDEHLDSALVIYKKIVEKFPRDPAYPRAFYNVGYISWELKKNDDAIQVFLKILESNFNEKERGGPGVGLMGEPYTLYKNRSSSILSDIYLEAKDYPKALKYIKLADKKYPYQHFCGNENAGNRIYVAVQYSKCYEGLNQIDDAIDVLWSYIFNYGLANNAKAVEQMKTVLLKKYNPVQLATELRNAEKTIVTKFKKEDGEIGYVTIFGNKINLHDDIDSRLIDPAAFKEYIKLKDVDMYKHIYILSEFYKALVNE